MTTELRARCTPTSTRPSSPTRHHALLPFSKRLEKALKAYDNPPPQAPAQDLPRRESSCTRCGPRRKRIRDGLRDSEYLILLASKEAADSEWAQQELRYWCGELKRTERLITILTEDVIAVDDEDGAIDWDGTDPLPSLLQEHLATVPLYAGCRGSTARGSGCGQPAVPSGSSMRSAPASVAWTNDMLGEEVLQHRRNMRWLAVGIVVMSPLASIASGMYLRVDGHQKARINGEASSGRLVAVPSFAGKPWLPGLIVNPSESWGRQGSRERRAQRACP